MGIEIERKFLVDNVQWAKLQKPEGVRYQQGYIVNDDLKTIRIRISDKTGFINFKGPTKGLSRPEFEYEVPLQDGMAIMDNFVISKVEKTRYCIDFRGKIWEIDVFTGDNEGLITAEIELKKEDEEFELPPWIEKEVSDDPRYANSQLSVMPYMRWK